MLWMPASAAFFRQALPDSEPRLTIIRTWTPSLIMPSQMLPNFAVSPSAFWMSDSMPAASKAACRLVRSLASHRGEVVASGRITPTFPVALPLLDSFPLLSPLSSPQAAVPTAMSPITASEAMRFMPLLLTICSTSKDRVL